MATKIRRKENIMTNREFYKAIANGEMNEELKNFALEGIKKLDHRNELRNSKPSKVSKENEPIKARITEILTTNDKPMLASEVASEMEISTQKASALLRQLVESGVLAVDETKVAKKGLQKIYRKK